MLCSTMILESKMLAPQLHKLPSKLGKVQPLQQKVYGVRVASRSARNIVFCKKTRDKSDDIAELLIQKQSKKQLKRQKKLKRKEAEERRLAKMKTPDGLPLPKVVHMEHLIETDPKKMKVKLLEESQSKRSGEDDRDGKQNGNGGGSFLTSVIKDSLTVVNLANGNGNEVEEEITVSGPGRILIIGDIHGCHFEMTMLLQKLNRQPEDTVILTGDIVNKGPDSVECIREARRQGALGVRGNHDEHALKYYKLWKEGYEVPGKWRWVRDMSEEDAEWLGNLPFSLRLPQYQTLIVHAGMIPGMDVENQELQDLIEMREIEPAEKGEGKGSKWQTVKKRSFKQGAPWASEWNGGDHVIFGHDARRGLQLYPRATGLDTGCVYGGRLTACVLPALPFKREHPIAEIVSVEAGDTYCVPVMQQTTKMQPLRKREKTLETVSKVAKQMVQGAATVAFNVATFLLLAFLKLLDNAEQTIVKGG